MVGRVVVIGFCGGVLWSFIVYIVYLFYFFEISLNMILQLFVFGEWKKYGLGIVISIILIGFFLIGVVFFYFFLLKCLKIMWLGVLYGLLFWLFVFFVFNLIFFDVCVVIELKVDIVIIIICIYLFYGLFVGYFILFEYNELNLEKLVCVLGMYREQCIIFLQYDKMFMRSEYFLYGKFL